MPPLSWTLPPRPRPVAQPWPRWTVLALTGALAPAGLLAGMAAGSMMLAAGMPPDRIAASAMVAILTLVLAAL